MTNLKSESLIIHARKRAAERYGLDLTEDDYQKLNDLARSATVVKRTSNRLTVRVIQVNGYPYRVVYDSGRHQIVTFLPQKRRDFKEDR